MIVAANILTGLVALLHVYFLVLDMYLWDKPFGLKTFGQTLASVRATKTLAMNQGFYNGFLAAGLVWELSLATAGGGPGARHPQVAALFFCDQAK